MTRTDNENREYLLRVREEIENHYNGTTDEDGEEVGLYDYLNNVLDFSLTIDSRMHYQSCKVWIALGGPNVWLDTAERALKLAWGGEREEIYLDGDICDEIDSYFEEIYNCR